MINLEKKSCEPLKELYQLDIIGKKSYDKLCIVGSDFDILNGLDKAHIQFLNKSHSFSSLISGTSTYIIAKFLVPILKPLSTNHYTHKTRSRFDVTL